MSAMTVTGLAMPPFIGGSAPHEKRLSTPDARRRAASSCRWLGDSPNSGHSRTGAGGSRVGCLSCSPLSLKITRCAPEGSPFFQSGQLSTSRAVSSTICQYSWPLFTWSLCCLCGISRFLCTLINRTQCIDNVLLSLKVRSRGHRDARFGVTSLVPHHEAPLPFSFDAVTRAKLQREQIKIPSRSNA